MRDHERRQKYRGPRSSVSAERMTEAPSPLRRIMCYSTGVPKQARPRGIHLTSQSEAHASTTTASEAPECSPLQDRRHAYATCQDSTNSRRLPGRQLDRDAFSMAALRMTRAGPYNTAFSCKRRLNEGARSAPTTRRLSAAPRCYAAPPRLAT